MVNLAMFKFVVCLILFQLAETFIFLNKPDTRMLRKLIVNSNSNANGLFIDMIGKTVFVAGVSDSDGYGWAIAKAAATAGARVLVGTWPPSLPRFLKGIKEGKYNFTLDNGNLFNFAKIYPLDVAFDTIDSIPQTIKENIKYKDLSRYSIQEVVDQIYLDFGNIDFLVHSIANGPEVDKPLLETSRNGYLSAMSASSYSLVSMVSRFGPIMKSGGSVITLTYLASDRVIPGYGGGMSSSKAALESDVRTLAYEAGRKFAIRVNSISAGPIASRAARAISGIQKSGGSFINQAIENCEIRSPLQHKLLPSDVGNTAAFLLSDMARSITGSVIYVDNGFNIMAAV